MSLGLGIGTKTGAVAAKTYTKDGLKLYMPFASAKEVKFVGEGSTAFRGDPADSINCGADSTLDVGTSNFTACAWFKTGSSLTTGYGDIVSKGDTLGGGQGWGLSLFYTGGNNKVYFQIGEGLANVQLASGAGEYFEYEKWHHVAGVRNQDIETFTLYLDGIEVGTASTSAIADDIDDAAVNFEIGDGQSNRPFKGSIKNVGYWNRVLSPTEIQNVMYKTYTELSGTLTSGLQGWWALESDYLDSTSNDNDGTAVNTPTQTTSLYGGHTPLIPRGFDNAPTVQADAIGTGYAYFDGGEDDHIDVGAIAITTNDVSICCWIKADSFVNNAGIVCNRLSGGDGSGVVLRTISSGTTVQMFIDEGTDTQGTLSAALNTGQWYHIAGVWDRSGSQYLYVDGILANSDAITDEADTLAHATSVKIGANEDGGTGFDGKIKNVGYWNGVLTQPQIQSIMEKTYDQLAETEKTNLVSWWGLDSYWGDNTTALQKMVEDEHNTTLGSELMDFDGQTGIIKSSEVSATSPWFAVGATDYDFATISGTTITFNNTGTWDSVRYAEGASANKIFKLTCTMSVTSGNIQIYKDTTPDTSHSVISVSGDYTFYYNTVDANFLIQFSTGAFVGSISNISIKEVLSSNAGVTK